MYAESVTPALQAIERAQHLIWRMVDADRSDLLAAQLVPGMFDCGTQLRTVGIFALRATYPLLGRDWPHNLLGDDYPEGPDGLIQRLGTAADQVSALPQAAFSGADERRITHVAGDAELTQTGSDYLRLFALPNLWFHLTMGYAIARQGGLEIGKADYDGWHAYAPGFSFVS